MNERVLRERLGVQLARLLRVAALAAAVGCAGAIGPAPQSVDLAPLLEVRPDLSKGMARAFPDYGALVLGGVQQWNGKPSRDGVVELVKDTYDTELDESHTWSVDATVTLFDTAESASRDLNDSCYSFAHGGASAPVRSRDGVFCISPVLHVRSDPLRMYLPSNLYSSWVIVRNDRLVVRLYERHVGSPKSAKNRIIAEIAERLGKLTAPPASTGEFVE
jgi:hypothetical protein